jgi:hypothetical protein
MKKTVKTTIRRWKVLAHVSEGERNAVVKLARKRGVSASSLIRDLVRVEIAKGAV